MTTFKNFIFLFFTVFLGITNNAWAYQLKDVAGYHVLSGTSNGNAGTDWFNITSGNCTGVTFPSPISSEVPSSKNEITIDPKLITSTYSCSTIYYHQGQAADACLVGIEITVQNNQITKVNLSATPLTTTGCEAPTNSPFILLGYRHD